MRLPNTGYLSARREASEEKLETKDQVRNHVQSLADRLKEAYEVVGKLNKVGKEKQKMYYDKNTKLRTFEKGDYVYLKEMAIGAGKSKKFRERWRGPFLIIQRYSDLNYQIRIKPGKIATVNITRLKKCHDPSRSKKDGKRTVPFPERKQTVSEWDNSDDEPLHLLVRPKLIPASDHRLQERVESVETTEAPAPDDEILERNETASDPSQQ
jgi:hypothetical protein